MLPRGTGGSAAVSGASGLLAGETQGLALDFTDDFYYATTSLYGSARVIDTGTPANNYNSHPYGLLTYTNPSAKMTMGPSGLLRFGAHNLILSAEDFSHALWIKIDATVTANDAVAPDGTLTADKVVFADASANILQSVTTSFPTNLSIWILGTASQTIQVNDGTNPNAVTLTGAWQQVTVNTTVANPFINVSTNGSTTATTVWLWRAHIRRTPSDDTYLATTSAARYALPYEWSSAGVLQGILVEEARTNLLTYSEQFDNAAWSTTACTVTANAAVSPDGQTTAELLTPTAVSSFHRINNAAAAAATTSGTLSCFVKPNGYTQIALRENSASGVSAVFLLTGSGSVVGTHSVAGHTASNAVITALANGWYRLSFTYTLSGSATSSLGIYVLNGTWTTGDPHSLTFTADGTSGAYVWGAGHDAGAFATSYIPTLASTVTRAADNISLATSAFPYLQSATTVYIKYNYIGATTTPYPIALDNGAGLSVFAGIRHNANQFNTQAGAVTISPGLTTPGSNKIAFAQASADRAVSANGNAANTSVAAYTPGLATSLAIGQLGGTPSVYASTCYISQIMYLPRRASNAELVTLTTP